MIDDRYFAPHPANDDAAPPVPANDLAPIYVDGVQKVAGRFWCHLFCADRTRLHAFARRLGLKRCWFHNASWPHYDISPRQREAALKLGATKATRRHTVEFGRKHGRRERRAAR